MSTLLIGSMCRNTPACSAIGAACLRLATAVRSASSRLTPAGSTTAMAFSRCVPNNFAAFRASRMLSMNSARQRQQPALAGVPGPRRGVEQHQLQAVLLQPASDSIVVELVHEQDLYPTEPSSS